MTKQAAIIDVLRSQGFRITKQRQCLIDIISKKECACCKEIYYEASKQDESIGIATVYRMINLLENAGVIDRKNMYHMECDCYPGSQGATIKLHNEEEIELSPEEWSDVLEEGLRIKGYILGDKISKVMLKFD